MHDKYPVYPYPLITIHQPQHKCHAFFYLYDFDKFIRLVRLLNATRTADDGWHTMLIEYASLGTERNGMFLVSLRAAHYRLAGGVRMRRAA